MVGTNVRTGLTVRLSEGDPSNRLESVRLGEYERSNANMDEEVARAQRIRLVEQFLRLNPPTFVGVEGSEAAGDFISRVERIFELMECMPWEKVLLATYSLYREADAWWKTMREKDMRHLGDVWEQFRQMFLERYFTIIIREDKAREFELLVQTEEMSVDQYEARFSALSKNAPLLVNTNHKRARKFERGLLPRIQRPLAALMLTNYGELYRRARKVEKTQRECKERELKERGNVVEAENSQRFTRSAMRGKLLRRGGPYRTPRYVQGTKRASPLIYLRRGGWHTGSTRPEVSKVGIQCFCCGRPGHMRRNCPQKARVVSAVRACQEGDL